MAMTTKFSTTALPNKAVLVDVLDRLVSADSVEDAWAVHRAAMESYGFDRLFYGFTRFKTQSGFGRSDDMLLLSSMPEAYMDRFMKDEMYHHAPMTLWARDNVGTMSWDWAARNVATLSERQLEVVEFNRSFGVTAGYTIAFKDAQTRHKGAIALSTGRGASQRDLDEIWGQCGHDINVLNQVAHLKFTALPLPRSRSRLSDRQREVLEWVGDGKTMQDIGIILGLTQATVEKHLRNARDALDVETTAQAVRKASVQNQIFIVES